MPITLEQAQRVINAALAKAADFDVPSTVTVLDTGARLVASVRQDGAPLVSIDSSFAKARTSVFFGGATTADLVPAIQPGSPLFTLGDSAAERLTFVAGGAPLIANGVLIGAVGSGGGTPDQDAEVAAAAIAAL